MSNPFRFAGAIWDSATGLYKMGERFYDPAIGRFTQIDPTGIEGYVYAADDPITNVDPDGQAHRPKKQSTGKSRRGRHEIGGAKDLKGQRGEKGDVQRVGKWKGNKLYDPWGKLIGVAKAALAGVAAAAVAVGTAWLIAKVATPVCGPFAPVCLIVL